MPDDNFVESGDGWLSECIAALSDAQILSLKRYARFKMLGVMARVSDADAMDLMQEAIVRTLDRRREWNPYAYRPGGPVDLVTHLKGCMRSIAYEWGGGLRRVAIDTEEGRRIVEERFERPSRFSISPQEYEERAQLVLERLRERLRDDVIGSRVFEGLLKEYSASEAQATLKINAKVYNAARKRISRRVHEVMREWQKEGQDLSQRREREQGADNA